MKSCPKKLFLLVAVACFGALSPAWATDGIYSKFGLDLGYAGRIGYMSGTTPHWAIFTYGAGTAGSPFDALDVSAPPGTTPPQIEGEVALAGVYSNLSVSGYGNITGERYEQTSSTETIRDHGTLTGTRHSSGSINSALNGGVASLKAVSVNAAALTPTAGSPTSLNLSRTNMTISNNPFGGKYVMRLTDFVLSGGSTLTLDGAAGSAFVLNISGNFNISGASKILLTGGLTRSDVLFNITGNPSGAKTEITGDSLFQGVFLAYNSKSGGQRTLTVTGHNTEADGELIANRIVVSSGAKVKHPKHKSE